MKVLRTMLSSVENQDGSGGGAGEEGGGTDSSSNVLGLPPDDVANILGLRPFFANMLKTALQPESAEAKRLAWIWTIVHAIFAVSVGLYLLFAFRSSVATYGSSPPPPATAQNPFVVFVTGELLLLTSRAIGNSRRGGGLVTFGLATQLFGDVIRDGRIALFLLGLGSWWWSDSPGIH